MAIDLGQAEKQKEIVGGPIPKGSFVKVKMEIRKPKKADPQDMAVTIFSSGLKGLDCQFTVVSGQFEGLNIWENWFLPPGMQTIKLTKGQEGACNGSFSKARGVIEAARALDPEDPAADRNINSWFDLHGLLFPVKIGIQKPKPGDLYINNTIAKILTVADEEYNEIMAGGEIISDSPIPEIPKQPGGHGSGDQKPAWSQTQHNKTQQGDHKSQQQEKKVNTPSWAQ